MNLKKVYSVSVTISDVPGKFGEFLFENKEDAEKAATGIYNALNEKGKSKAEFELVVKELHSFQSFRDYMLDSLEKAINMSN